MPTEEAGTIHVRYYENGGQDDPITLRFHRTPACASAVDLDGKVVSSDLTLSGNTLTLTAKAHSIGQIKVRF